MKANRDLILVLIWPILASIICFVFKVTSTFISTLLFFGVPAIYLSYLKKDYIKKSVLFSLVISIPIAIIFDYIMEVTGGWFLPSSIFDPYRLFGYVVVEQLIWLFLFIYYVIMYYEVFLEKNCTPKLAYPELKYLAILFGILLILFVATYLFRESLLNIKYFYLISGTILGLIPVILILLNFPRLYAKFFKAGSYFFYASFLYEITALSLGQWTFPNENQFIGFIEFLGVRFPFEEFFFWIMLGAIAVLSYYEFFDDDKK